MRYGLLALIFLVNHILMVSGNPRSFSHCSKKSKPGNCDAKNLNFCKINLESTNMASKAAAEAKAAKDAQPCASEEASKRVREQLADKAEQAARAAAAALKGKRQLLIQLLRSLNDTNTAVEDIKDASKHSRSSMAAINRMAAHIEHILEQFQTLYDDVTGNLGKFAELAGSFDNDTKYKQSLLAATQRRVSSMKNCLMKAKEDLQRIENIAEQANSAAREAKERINAVRVAVMKIKRLRKKDVNSLKWILKRLASK